MEDVTEVTQKSRTFANVKLIWQEEPFQILIFVVVQILVGQAGLLLLLVLSYQGFQDIGKAWDSFLRSGSHYTFSIAILASACSVIACEFVEAVRDKATVTLWQTKAVWTMVAAVVILIQACLVGPLLVPSTEASPSSAIEAEKATIAVTDAQAKTIGNPLGAIKISQEPKFRYGIGLILWMLSCFIAFQLFCLNRMQFIHDRHARRRSEDVKKLSSVAEAKTTTDFGEQL